MPSIALLLFIRPRVGKNSDVFCAQILDHTSISLRVLCAETAAHRQYRDQCYTWFQLWLSALNYRQTFTLDPSNEDNPRYLAKDFGRRKGHRMAMEGTERVSAHGV